MRSDYPKDRELRNSCVMGLAKRLGEAARPDIEQALSDRSPNVRAVGVRALEAISDDRHYEELLSWLPSAIPASLRSPKQFLFSALISYLIRTSMIDQSGDRFRDLKRRIREHWEEVPNIL